MLIVKTILVKVLLSLTFHICSKEFKYPIADGAKTSNKRFFHQMHHLLFLLLSSKEGCHSFLSPQR
jgi:hypothetical protein